MLEKAFRSKYKNYIQENKYCSEGNAGKPERRVGVIEIPISSLTTPVQQESDFRLSKRVLQNRLLPLLESIVSKNEFCTESHINKHNLDGTI